MDNLRHIAAIPLFEGLSEPQLGALASAAIKRSYKKGQTIFSEGDEAAGFYVVMSGRVKVYKVSPEGKEQIFHIFESGEVFGEVTVFAGQDFPASAAAYAQCAVLFIPRRAFIEQIKRDPALALNMLAVLSRRLRKFALLIEDLSLKEVPGRLATYLLYLSDKQGNAGLVDLDISKGQLAALLGTIQETLSRILRKMTQQGLIHLAGARIRIMDRHGLEEIAKEGRKLS